VKELDKSLKPREVQFTEKSKSFLKNEYLVQTYCYFYGEAKLYILMELCENGPLSEFIDYHMKKKKPISELVCRCDTINIFVCDVYLLFR
jgi:serine/threonine protein kinase